MISFNTTPWDPEEGMRSSFLLTITTIIIIIIIINKALYLWRGFSRSGQGLFVCALKAKLHSNSGQTV